MAHSDPTFTQPPPPFENINTGSPGRGPDEETDGWDDNTQGKGLTEKDIVLGKGTDIVVQPLLSIYRITHTFIVVSPSDYGWDDEDVLPYIEVFPLMGDGRKAELEQMIEVLYEVLETVGRGYNKHQDFNISITIEGREEE